MGNIIRVLTIIFERVIPAFRNVVPQARAVLGFGGGIKFPFLSRFNKRHGTDMPAVDTAQSLSHKAAYTGRLECGCGCGFKPAPEAMRTLETLAARINGLHVTSAARCPKHNANVGGAANSAHTRGLAFDIAAPANAQRYNILKALFSMEIKRVGINFERNFIHFDTDPSLPNPVVFRY